jgi:GNAT superfamily N-acetyltransferase
MQASDLVSRVCETYRTQRARGGESVDRPLATLVRAPEHPDVWDANHASAIRASAPEEIEALFAECDRFLPETVRYRKLFVDVETPPPFVARLLQDGVAPAWTVQLVLEGDLDASPRPAEIREAVTDEDWEAVALLTRLDHLDEAARERREPLSETVTAGLVATRRRMAPDQRAWIVRNAGEDAGTVYSWPGRNGVGMVEYLFTSPRHRRQGLATALVGHAVRDARERGAGPVLIGASAAGDGVPRRMYEDLGFRPVCATAEFTLRSQP